jgi:hypothetical protein
LSVDPPFSPREDAGARQRDGIFAGTPAFGGDAGRARDEEVRQAVEVVPVERHQPGLFVRQHVLAKLCGKRRQPFGDCGEARLGLRLEPGAGAGEIEMIAGEHARLFGRKPEAAPFGVQRVDAPEQRVVQIGLVAMARQDRRHLPLDRLQFVIGRRARQIEEDAPHLVEAAPAALQGLDRIGEGRPLRVCSDSVDLLPGLVESGLERRPEVGGFDALERRRLEGLGPGLEKRVRVDL